MYLFDNETSYVVLLSSLLGTGIEVWKVTKAFEVSFNRERFPYISLKDRCGIEAYVRTSTHSKIRPSLIGIEISHPSHGCCQSCRASYSNKQTKQYDADAMRYLSYALYPLVIGYSIYALMYKTHKSWYSWILSSLVGAVYMFGFILMCPQVRLLLPPVEQCFASLVNFGTLSSEPPMCAV